MIRPHQVFTVLFAAELVVNIYAHWFRAFFFDGRAPPPPPSGPCVCLCE